MDARRLLRFLAGPFVAWLGSGLLTRPLVRDPTGTTTAAVVAVLLVVVGVPLGVAFAQRRVHLKRTVLFVFVANAVSVVVLLVTRASARLLVGGLQRAGVAVTLIPASSLGWRLFGLALSVLSVAFTYRLLLEEKGLRVREANYSS